MEAVLAEGKEELKGDVEELASGEVGSLAEGLLAAGVARQLDFEGDDLDEEGRREVESTKQNVVKQLRVSAPAFQVAVPSSNQQPASQGAGPSPLQSSTWAR